MPKTASLPSPVDRLSVAQLARREGVHSASVWRWMLHGVRGVKLRAMRVGGRRFVTEADWISFSVALNSDLATAPAAQTPTTVNALAERAGAELEKLLGAGDSRRHKNANA